MATAKKPTQAAKIRDYAAKRPNAKIADIAHSMGIRYQAVYQVLKAKPSVKTPKADKNKWKMLHMSTSKEAVLNKLEEMPLTSARKAEIARRVEAERMFEMTKGRDRVELIEPKADNVNHPAHYKVGGIETIDFIEAKGLSYHLGNVVKYIARADSKGNRKEDLLKAQWYLNREIAKL